MATKSTIIFVGLIVLLLTGSAAADMYSCRDRQGRLHVSDSLHALPDDCRPEARKLQDTDPDNLHYVPDSAPSAPDPRVEQLLQEQKQLQQQRQDAADRFTQKAQELLADYKQAQLDRRNAVRIWSYNSRRIIQESQEQIAAVRTEKQQLLLELDQWRLPSETESRIRGILAEIDAAD